MIVIGITGGVGCGKSSLLSYLEKEYQARILPADEVAHEVQEPGTEGYFQLVELLGSEVLEEMPETAESEAETQAPRPIDRKKMAAAIFSDPALLEQVNGIIHPAVRRQIESEIEKERAKGVREFFFVEAALLIECGYDEVVDEMWYIYCDPDERRRRLKAQRGYSDEKIDSIMKSQLSHEAFLAGTDVMIDNSGTPQESYVQIDREMERLKKKETGATIHAI
ncbi:MAG: dephospho-CoA kinase [Lachnospiraceae bacterium]|nr:dephospho-CoA kinase [Lachnospiraceae bacterium]